MYAARCPHVLGGEGASVVTFDGGGRSGRFGWPVRRRAPGPAGTAEDIAVQDIAEQEAADRRLPPPAPEPMVDPRPRLSLALLRLAGLGLALVLVLALAMVKLFVAGPPSIAELRAQAGVDRWTTLDIGVKDDQPGVAYYDPKSKIWSGFDIDIAHMIAEDLGFRRQDVRFYTIESEDRIRMQATDAKGNRVPVKLVVASYSITPARVAKGANFSKPYLYTEQSVVTLKGHKPVATFADLKGEKVCTLSASTSLDTLGDARGVISYSRLRMSDCVNGLYNHEFDAVSTDAAILAGFVAHDPQHRLKHWDLGYDASERWGVNVGENTALRKLVDLTLYKSWKDPHDDRWELAYQNNLQTELSASWPTPIAVAQQPPAVRPDVRRLPWENDLP
jgi:glutamate transport system substrate-binding protein